MKITPFILFLILLVTLVISMLFSDSLREKEGFVSFGNTNTDIQKMKIPQYGDKEVTYLYDNMYFDGANGNLIEVDSPFCGNVRVPTTTSGNVSCNDITGTSIKNIYITTRSNSIKSYSTVKDSSGEIQFNNNTEISLPLTPSNNHFSYITTCPTISDTTGYKYQTFYASFENDTYMHIMGLDPTAMSGKNIQSFYYNSASATMKYIPFMNSNSIVPPYNQTFSCNQDSNNGKLYKDVIYNKSNIYQISKYVKYDLVSGCILVLNPTSNTYNIYSRTTGQMVTDSSNSIIDNISSFVSWIIPDNNNGMIITMTQGLNTLIMIINPDPNEKKYVLSYCVRFTDKEVRLHSNSLTITNETTNKVDSSGPCNDELSCKWYYYFKTIGNDTSVLFKNDYIKKTQIVPPVCPTCPNCPGSGVCTTCGGKGGSGTKDSSGNILRDTATGATGLVKDVVGGTVGLGKDVVGGTVGLGKDVVGGTVGLVKETVGGAVGLVKDTASGIYNLGTKEKESTNKPVSDSAFGYVPNNASTPVDQYSYYGALQSKGGNYMPVTADFSSFRR